MLLRPRSILSRESSCFWAETWVMEDTDRSIANGNNLMRQVMKLRYKKHTESYKHSWRRRNII